MVVVANTHIFGGGPYSVAGGKMAREVGKPQRTLAEIAIARRKGGVKIGKTFRPGMVQPFMPKKITEPYHPSGNSVCYMIQTAHLMGCDPIYLLGFTLQSGTPYHFGKVNPVTRKGAFYDIDPPMHWLQWYESCYPGRVKVCSGWSGPIYEVFQLERFHAEEAEGPDAERNESDQRSGSDAQVERPGSRGDEPARDDGQGSQSLQGEEETNWVW
jgi:hypothetical protein